jgi:hypothetical protein
MRCCHINLSVLSSIVHFPIPGDDCCAFAAMASWCVVYGLPLYMSHDTVRSFRRHMTYTLMRGNVHFLLPTRVCNTRFRFLPMSMHFTKIIFLFFMPGSGGTTSTKKMACDPWLGITLLQERNYSWTQSKRV